MQTSVEGRHIGVCAGDRANRIGRADQPRQLAGSADAPREQTLTRRWICAISRREGFAQPQLQRANRIARASKYAWRLLLSMHRLSGLSPQAA